MKKHILLVEDEPALQKALGEFLREHGYTVLSASDGERGRLMAREKHPDLILLDLVLPRLSGIELLQDLRRDEETKSIPVIILTNVENSDSVEQAIALGAKAYLIKTAYSLPEVLEKVEQALGQAQEG